MANVNLLWDKSFTYYNQWDNPYFPANNYGYYSDIPSSNQSQADSSSMYNNYDSLAYDRRNDFTQEPQPTQNHLEDEEAPPTYNDFLQGIKTRQSFNRVSSNDTSSFYNSHYGHESNCSLCPPKTIIPGRSLSDYGGPTFRLDPNLERLVPNRPNSSLTTPIGSYESVTPPPDYYRTDSQFSNQQYHHQSQQQYLAPPPTTMASRYEDQRSIWSQMESLGVTPEPSPQPSEEDMLDQILTDLEDMEFGKYRSS
ncbi:hypothetical protein TCAL_17017 [Tigriopus californicus]|uniref:Sox C-terminal domain-containing protein n=1 Tax=Tigriopus californicus TaxID=6832 RepID=A0A553PHQ8_TIGCA|nr:hypothetical protein TCAL_17017 [Tigriopus californicus]